MSSRKLSMIFLSVFGLLCLAILFGAYKLVGSLQARSETLLQLKSDYATTQQKQDQILQNKNDLKTYADLNTIAQSVVPHDKNSDIVTLQIVNIARKSGIAIDKGSGITFPSSNLGGAGQTGSSSLSQLSRVPGLSGVYELPITVQQGSDTPVSYTSFLTFLANLQQNRRTATISDISITPDKNNSKLVSFTITIIEYIKP